MSRSSKSIGKLRNKLAVTTAITGIMFAGGYGGGRMAYAGCTGTGNVAPAVTDTCSGSGTATVTAADLTATVVMEADSTFSVDTSATSGADGINIVTTSAGGGVSFDDKGYGSSILGNRLGISIANTGTGNLSITTTGNVFGNNTGIAARNNASGSTGMSISVADVTGYTYYGIQALHNGSGSVSITSSGNVFGGQDGIRADANSSYSTGMSIESYNVTGSSGYGVIANHSGGGNLTITSSGNISGGNRGISARTSINSIDLYIDVVDVGGDVFNGISAIHFGTGELIIKSSGSVEGGQRGIFAESLNNTLGMSIDVMNVSGGNLNALFLNHLGTGDLSISVSGEVVGASGTIDATASQENIVVNNNMGGNIIGNVNLDATGTDASLATIDFNNNDGGIFSASGDSTLDATGNVTFTNSGLAMISVTEGSASISLTSSDSGSESNFVSYGYINMQDAAAGGIADANDNLTINADNIEFDGAQIALDTFMGYDSSPTDLLTLIANNDLTGSANLIINPINPSGYDAQTINGIKVIDVSVGGTDSLVVGLSNIIAIGAYDYDLVQAPDGDWYLQSTCRLSQGCKASPFFDGHLALAAAAGDLGHMFNSNYHVRVGGVVRSAEELATSKAHSPAVWTKVFGNWAESDGKVIEYDNDTYGFQFGADFAVSPEFTVGLMGGYGKTEGDGFRLDELETELDGKMGGVYVVYKPKDKPIYVDAVLSYTDLDMKAEVKDAANYLDDDFDGRVITASVEAGYEFQAGHDWVIEPQLQLSHSEVDFDKFTSTSGADISLKDGDETRGRASLRFENRSIDGFRPYLRTSLIGTSGGDYQVHVDDEIVEEDSDNFKGGIDAGFTLDMNNLSNSAFQLDGMTYLNLGYEAGSDNKNIQASAGLRFKF